MTSMHARGFSVPTLLCAALALTACKPAPEAAPEAAPVLAPDVEAAALQRGMWRMEMPAGRQP